VLSLVNGARCQLLQRSRSLMPASRAIRSSSDGQVMVRDEPLVRDVELVNAEIRVADVEGAEPLAVREPSERGDTDLDHEAAGGVEMAGDVLEAADPLFLGGQVVDRVEDQEGERKYAVDPCRGEVADRDVDGVGAGFRAEVGDHVLRELDAVDLDAALRERQRDSAGAIPSSSAEP
jgi:hypothetical protein